MCIRDSYYGHRHNPYKTPESRSIPEVAAFSLAIEREITKRGIDVYKRQNQEWLKAGYDRAVIKVYHTEATEKDGIVSITCDFSIAAVHIQPFLRCHAKWNINGGGEVNPVSYTHLDVYKRQGSEREQ